MTVRLTRGRDIAAACGQLAGSSALRACGAEPPRARRAGLTGAGLAGAQQPLAQLGLLLGTRVPAGDVGELVEVAQPEQLQELVVVR